MFFSTPIKAIFLVQPRPQMIKSSNMCTYSMWLKCCRSWLLDSRSFHLWWPMKLCLTNPQSILKDGRNLVRLSSCDDFWWQLLSLLFFNAFLVVKDKRMWVLNYIKYVGVGKSHNDVTTVVVNAQCWWVLMFFAKRIENKDLIMK